MMISLINILKRIWQYVFGKKVLAAPDDSPANLLTNKTMEYKYPQVLGGYRWNMLQRCKHEVGIEPISSGDTGGQTILTFNRELTPEELVLLNQLMDDKPTFPPPNTRRFKIVDIWEKLQSFNLTTGHDLRIYYSESVPNSGVFDTIELHSSFPLTTKDQNDIKAAYADLITSL